MAKKKTSSAGKSAPSSAGPAEQGSAKGMAESDSAARNTADKAAGKNADTTAGKATGNTVGKNTSQPQAPVRRKRRRWLWLTPLLLIAAAAAAGAWLWFEYLAEYPQRIDRLEERVSRIAELETGFAELERQRAEEAALLAADAQSARLDAERIRDLLEARLSSAERSLEALGSPPAGQQLTWKLDAADRLLALADRQNQFARDPQGAALALREALELLEQADDPRFGGLRAEIKEQARMLERMPARDIEGVVVRLGALLARIEGLRPASEPARPEAEQAEELPPEGWARAAAAIRRTARSLISVRRTESDLETLLSEADTQTLQRLLMAELHLARLAYIQGDLEAYSASLVAARARLTRLYATDDSSVADTLDDIDELLEAGLKRETPDIAAALARFRALRTD